MSLYLIRHGESVGNDRGIVQGNDFDPGLTATGREQARTVAQELATAVTGPVSVRTSPARRARETAAIVGETVGQSAVTDGSLGEVDPGVIAGFSKSVLATRYPDLLEVWEARGDLDRIPRAESGPAAQARALLVLDRLSKRPDEIVVAHAAFNRYLLNTARGTERTAPIGHDPTTWHEIAGALDGVAIETVADGVRLLETDEASYVLKRDPDSSAQRLAFHAWISEYVNSKRPILPAVLAWEMADGAGRTVLAHARGDHQYGPLSAERRRQLCQQTATLATLMGQTDRNFAIETLTERIRRIADSVSEPAIAALGDQLLETEAIESDGRPAYVHYDLHRDNILFADGSVTLLDLDGFCRAPALFQPASLFMAGFLLEDVAGFELETASSCWPRPLDWDRLVVLMLARAYIGIGFFTRKRAESGLTPSEADIHSRYLQSAHRIANTIGWSLPAGFPGSPP